MANLSRSLQGGLQLGGAGAQIGGVPGAAIGAGLGILPGLFSGDDESEQAREYMQKAIALYDSLGYPPNLSGPIILQQLKAGGQLTPQLEGILKEELYNPSTVSDNAETRTDLTSALNQIRSRAFGVSPEQAANQQKLLQQVNANTQSQNAGIQNQAQMRGEGSGGNALMAKLLGVQSGAQQASNNALQIGANTAQQQNAALKDYLTGLGALRTADTSRDEFNATAQNAANQYKLQNASSRQARNVGAQNTANQAMWSNQNATNLYNTNQSNQELERQKQAERQYWQDQLELAKGKAGAYSGYGSQLANQANNENQNWNNIFQGVGNVATGVAQANRTDKLNADSAKYKQQYLDVIKNKQPGTSSYFDYNPVQYDENGNVIS